MREIPFDFLTNYKYYGRRKSLLKEDELDDALGLTPDQAGGGNPPDQNTQNPDATPPEQPIDAQMGEPNPPADEPSSGDSGSKVELDVTQLVLKQDEISKSVQDVLLKLSDLVKNGDNLKAELNQKIADLEGHTKQNVDSVKQELQKRAPTAVEKLQLQSLHSFPYNVKLTDYWEPTKEDKYKYAVANVKTNMNDDPTFNVDVKKLPDIQQQDNEYILRQSEIMKGYSENFVKNSF